MFFGSHSWCLVVFGGLLWFLVVVVFGGLLQYFVVFSNLLWSFLVLGGL